MFVKMRGKLENDLKDSNSWMRFAKCVVAIETFAATSARFDLLISGEYWNVYRRLRQDDLRNIASGQRAQMKEYSEDEHFEKLIGCPVVVIYSLGRMVMLQQSREEMEGSSIVDPEWYNTWAIETIKLEDLLLRWKPCSSNSDKMHLAESFRHASLIFYFRNLRRLPYIHETVQHHVQATFDHLQGLTFSSQLEGIALWPTMIAAIEIDERDAPELMIAAIDRIRIMRRQKRDLLYQNAERALKLLWERRSKVETWEERVAVDWHQLSQEMGWKWCMV